MKICLLGNLRPAHSTESDLLWTMRDLGHEVVTLQEDEVSAQDVLDGGMNADLLWWMHTWGWEIRGDMLGTLAILRASNKRTCSFSLDLLYSLDREYLVATHPFFRTDIFFGVDGGSEGFYRQHRVNHKFIRPGVVKRDCWMAEKKGDWLHDVAFVGSTSYHASWPHRPRLIQWLRDTYGDRFGKYGNPEQGIRGDALNELYSRVKVVVGDSLCPNYSHPLYWSDRMYECMGRGGMIIMPHVRGMCEEFTDGVHLRYYEYQNWKELKRLIDYYVAHDAEREKIRVQGHQHVKSQATYHDRMKQMMEQL